MKNSHEFELVYTSAQKLLQLTESAGIASDVDELKTLLALVSVAVQQGDVVAATVAYQVMRAAYVLGVQQGRREAGS